MRWRILGILLLAITIEGAELEVVGRGGSRYQVVLPDQVKNKAVDYYLQLTGKLVVKCLHQASGTTLPLVRESDMEPDRPSIFIGHTEALRKNGIKPELLKAWEHRIEVRNGNIYLYGRDEGNWGMNSSPDYHQLLLGSVKAVTVFLEQFAGTRFSLPWRYGDFSSAAGTDPYSRIIQLPESPCDSILHYFGRGQGTGYIL